MLRTLSTLAVAAAITPAALAETLPDPWATQTYRLADPFIEKGLVPGMVVGLRRGDRTAIFRVGHLTPEAKTRPTPDTLYEIGSITKVFTAILLAEADRRGELSFDDPLSKHLPEGIDAPTKDGKEITLRMLSTHTSGLPRLPANFAPADIDNPYADYDEAKLWAFIDTAALNSTPGDQYAYSNLATGLLGTILARAADTTYEDLLRDRVLAPLGMTDSAITLTDEQQARLAPPFAAGNAPAKTWSMGALEGAGALRSTAKDMLTFAGRVLKPEGEPLDDAIIETLAIQGQVPEAPYYYATGWHVAGDRSTLWHSGQTGGYHAELFISRPLDAAVVVLSNGAEGQLSQLAEKLIQFLAGMEIVPVDLPDTLALEPAHLDRLTGVYSSPLGITYHITREGNALFARIEGQPALRVWPESRTAFAYREVEARLEFDFPEEDDTAPATMVTLFQNGMTIPCMRTQP